MIDPFRCVRFVTCAGALCATVAMMGCGRGSNQSGPEPPRNSAVASGGSVARANVASLDPTPLPMSGDTTEHRVAFNNADPAASPAHRPPDSRPRHDDARLEQFGIKRYESKRLKLYTDIDPAIARTLPPYIDSAYHAWEDYFGPIPPAPGGGDYQITGYLMSDKELFRRAGLIPMDLPPFMHGRHRGAEFWMNEQEHDYYRRHLLIHESTHCFMTAMPGVAAPLWYMEGMAELFGTHSEDPDGLHFRVMPQDKQDFPGLGRISLMQDEVRAGSGVNLADVGNYEAEDFLETDAYAWSWALCKLLDTHPRYRDRFRKLGRRVVTGDPFLPAFEELVAVDMPDLRTEWQILINDLTHGYDFERMAIDFRPGTPLQSGNAPRAIEIAADRGWQSSGVLLEQGTKYRLTASGQFAVAQQPKVWTSEPQGISFWYKDGKPLGMLLGTIRGTASQEASRQITIDVIPVGTHYDLTAPVTGTLYLRVNDFSNQLSDNSGTIRVAIQRD